MSRTSDSSGWNAIQSDLAQVERRQSLNISLRTVKSLSEVPGLGLKCSNSSFSGALTSFLSFFLIPRSDDSIDTTFNDNLDDDLDNYFAFHCLFDAYKKAGGGFFTRACSDQTSGNGFKLTEGGE